MIVATCVTSEFSLKVYSLLVVFWGRFQEKGNLEVLLFTIQSRMRANNQKVYTPHEGKLVSDINRVPLFFMISKEVCWIQRAVIELCFYKTMFYCQLDKLGRGHSLMLEHMLGNWEGLKFNLWHLQLEQFLVSGRSDPATDFEWQVGESSKLMGGASPPLACCPLQLALQCSSCSLRTNRKRIGAAASTVELQEEAVEWSCFDHFHEWNRS